MHVRKTDLIKEIEILSKADDLEESSDSGQFGPKLESRDRLGNQYDLSPPEMYQGI